VNENFKDRHANPSAYNSASKDRGVPKKVLVASEKRSRCDLLIPSQLNAAE